MSANWPDQTIDRESGGRPTQLFALRVWQAELGEGCSEWRGQRRHVTSGRTHYLRDWRR